MTLNRWRLLFGAIGAAILIGGGVTLLTPVSVFGTECGSVASPASPASGNKDGTFLDPAISTFLSGQCDAARASRQNLASGVMLGGLFVILAAVIIRQRPGLGLGPSK